MSFCFLFHFPKQKVDIDKYNIKIIGSYFDCGFIVEINIAVATAVVMAAVVEGVNNNCKMLLQWLMWQQPVSLMVAATHSCLKYIHKQYHTYIAIS